MAVQMFGDANSPLSWDPDASVESQKAYRSLARAALAVVRESEAVTA